MIRGGRLLYPGCGAACLAAPIDSLRKVEVTYKITEACLKCGVCVPKCPERAITEELSQIEFHTRQLTLHHVRIDPERCNDCGTCVSEEYWCPAQAIVKA